MPDWLIPLALAIGAIAVGAAIAVRAGGWLYTRWPSTLVRARLEQKLGGLVEFGLDGAYLSLRERRSGTAIVFRKRGPAGAGRIEVTVTPQLTETQLEAVRTSLMSLGVAAEHVTPSQIVLREASELEPTKLEAIARLIARSLGHRESTRYRVAFEGPSDDKAVRRYYGWERRS